MVRVHRTRRASGLFVILASCLLTVPSAVASAQGKPPAGKPDAPAGKDGKGTTPSGKPDSSPAKPPAKQKPKKPMTQAQKIELAGKLFKEARAKFEANDYAGALPLYVEADEIYPGPTPKFFAAVSLDRLERYPEAIAAYQKFIDSAPPPEKFKDKLDTAKQRIAEIPKTPARVMVTTEPANPPGLKFTVDGNPASGPEVAVPPGKHVLGVTADGFEPAKQDIEVAYAEKRAVTVKLKEASTPVAAAPPKAAAGPAEKPTPAPLAPVEKDDGGGSRVPAYVTLGLAGAGAIVGTIFGVQALSAKSEFNSNPTSDNADTAERNALIADMSFAVAITFGVTGTVLLLSSGNEKKAGRAAPPPKRAFVTPYVGKTGGGAAASLTF